MQAYQAPGVYRQEIVTHPEPPFLTGVPAFLGYARQGPVNEPQRLSLWPQFTETFGTPLANGYLAYAVRGFFENDGLICYVVRLDDTFEALSGLRAGLASLVDLERIDLLCAPDIVRNTTEPGLDMEAVTSLQHELLAYCHNLGDRFSILDAIYATDVALIDAQRSRLNSDFGALYHPWLWVPGPAGNLYVPPCGHVAGIYARNDRQVGSHRAPANEALSGVLDVRVNPTDPFQGRPESQGINFLRAFPGRGIRVWGARTLSDDPNWTYVNVRRLFVTISRWLTRFMSELAFESNDIRLWVRIVRELTAFFDNLFRRGALKGQTAAEAFYVKCDGETNPSMVTNASLVVTEVGVAPIAPGEFIVARIIHGDRGVVIEPAT